MVEGVMSFEGYKIDKMSYERTSESRGKTLAEISPQFLFFVVQSPEEEYHFNVIIGVRVGEDEEGEEEEALPFQAEIVMRGFYKFKPTESDGRDMKAITEQVLLNGCAILFPYLRSTLTDLTSKSYHNPIMLPTINFTSLLDDRDLESMILTNDVYETY